MNDNRIELDFRSIKSLDDIKKTVLGFFKDYQDIKIILFGSRANGSHRKYSDVDIGFLSGKNIEIDLSKLRCIFEESNFPYKVDLIDLSKTDKQFRNKVFEEGISWKN